MKKLDKSIKYQIRPISDKEIPFLKDYLYMAMFVPPNSKPFPISIVDKSFFKLIYENWGKEGDIGLAVRDKKTKQIIGMAWVRLYEKVNLPLGIIDTTISALSIAIHEDYRKIGIGTELMVKLINSVKEKKFKGISLSVDRRNYAVKLYKKCGFKLYQESKEYNPLYFLEF